MFYTAFLLMQGLLLGLIIVASNPSPYFGALGLVVASGMGCGLLAVRGATFLALVLVLIYLGGMMVVFAYSSALASDSYPEAWGNPRVAVTSLIYVAGVLFVLSLFSKNAFEEMDGVLDKVWERSGVGGDQGGAAFLYSSGGLDLVIAAWALLLTLLVVLEVVRGGNRGALRAL